MEKIKIYPILSVALSPEENEEIEKLSEYLGVSLSHLGRALIRTGLKAVTTDRNKEKAFRKLVQLGR